MIYSSDKNWYNSLDYQSYNDFQISFNNNINLQSDQTAKFEYIETSKTTGPIDVCSKSTQTEYSPLYVYESNEDIKEQEIYNLNKNKRKRKDCTDLIRSKLFNYFNKMLYKWIISSEDINDEIKIQPYCLRQNNKESIKEVMTKKLKDIFLPKNPTEQITNKLFIKKLETNYKTLFDYFISDDNISKENEDFFKNFVFLNNYLETLKESESDEYINKVSQVAKEYESWLGKKVHLFKKKISI